LLEQGIDPSQILLLTFTNKAAKEMLERAEALTHVPVKALWGGTFHHIANRLLRQLAPLVGYQSNFTILDEDDSQTMLKHLLKDFHLPPGAHLIPSPGVAKSIISFSRNTGQPIADVVELKYPRLEPLTDELQKLARDYAENKRTANVMDFDDLLALLGQALAENPKVQERLQQQFPWILVDEYQDTNHLQSELIYHLAGPTGNVVAVGDDAQSIYAFRGADISNILDFRKRYPKAAIYKLETNYRSTPEILALANASIGNNLKQYPKALQPVVASGSKPKILVATGGRDEAHQVVTEIVDMARQGIPLMQMAVLFRATFHSQNLEFELTSRGIPYDYRGGLRFFERAHIKDVLAFLRVAHNPGDQPAWLRLLTMPAGIGPATAAGLLAQLRGHKKIKDIISLEPTMTRGQAGWQILRDSLGRVANAVDQSPSNLVTEVLRSWYREYLETQYRDWQDRLADLEQLGRFAATFADLQTFLSEASLQEQYAANRQKPGQKDDSDKLVLSTIHQAKGLEWHAVFVVNLAQGSFPHRRSLFSSEEIEEERRLFYVAVTRARKLLYLSYPLINEASADSLNQRSQFLDELPYGVTDERNAAPQYADETEQTIQLDGNGERHGFLPDITKL
jgi:DNA helicase-2/ATP-dependent DNA helicase PcrA